MTKSRKNHRKAKSKNVKEGKPNPPEAKKSRRIPESQRKRPRASNKKHNSYS